MSAYKEVFSPVAVYVTVGYFSPSHHNIFLRKHKIEIGEYPDTVIDSALNVRDEIAKQLKKNTCVIFVDPETLYFMVYKSNTPEEKPYLWSDNAPEAFVNPKLKKPWYERLFGFIFKERSIDE